MITLDKVTFYTGCKINPNYFDTYRTQALMDSYLATLDSISISSPMFYIEFDGIITVSISGIKLTEGYNYMTAEYSDKEKLYFFITDWSLRNGVVTMAYRIDTWHTFIENVSMKIGHRILKSYKSTYASQVNSLPYSFIQKPLINGAADYEEIGRFNSNTGYLIVQGYAYYGVKPASGQTSSVRPWVGILVTSSSNSTPVAISLPWGEQYLGKIYQDIYDKTLGGTTKWYFEVTRSWIIPNAFCNGDMSMTGYTSLQISSADVYVTLSDISATLKLYIPDTSSNSIMGREIHSSFSFMNTDNTVNVLVGTKQHLLPVEPLVGLQYVTTSFCLGGFSPIIKLNYGNYNVDITDEFIVEINFTPESALVAQQRKMEFIGQVASAVSGIAGGIVGMGSASAVEARTQTGYGVENAQAYLKYGYASKGHQRSMKNQRMYTTIMSGNDALTEAGKGGRIAAQVGRGLEMGGSIMDLLAGAFTEYSEVHPSGASESIFSSMLGLYVVKMSIQNIDNVIWVRDNFGIMTDEYVDSFNFDTSVDFDLQAYDDVYLEGKIPEQYITELEGILKGGTRVWNK